MSHRFHPSSLATLLVVLLATAAANAQPAGTIAGLEGEAQLGRGDAWRALKTGDGIEIGDRLRTGRPGKLHVLFVDDTVLTIADETEIVVAAPLFDPSRPEARSLLRLVEGKLRAVVSSIYGEKGASFELETATAAIGVRGTQFVAAYDAAAERTDVVGVSGQTEVHGLRDRRSRGVFVTTREITQVARGEYPTPVRLLDDATFRQYLEGLEFVGQGASESMTVGEPLFATSLVPGPDRAERFAAPTAAEGSTTQVGPGAVSVGGVQGPAPTVENEDNYLPSILSDQPPAVIDAIDRGQLDVEF